jgi:hypothetical protein
MKIKKNKNTRRNEKSTGTKRARKIKKNKEIENLKHSNLHGVHVNLSSCDGIVTSFI